MLRNFTGSTGVRAVIAVLMLLFVVACAGSDSGIKRQRDEARAAAEAAEQARMAAEEQAKMDAEAAAAAEQARKDAEAAAAAAAEQAKKDAEAAAAAEEARKAAEAAAAAAAAAAEDAYEQAKMDIAAAETAEAAQEAYDAVKDQVTAARGEMLQAAVDARTAELAEDAREASQKMALMEAAGMIDTSDLSTQALVNAARTAIAGLRQALDDADDVSDADKAMYMTQLTNATNAVDMAQGGIDTDTRRTMQMAALSGASSTLQAALAELSGTTPTQAQLDAANNALTALNSAITGGADLTADEKAPYQREANNAAAPIQMAQTAFDEKEGEDQNTANAAMAVTAERLYAGLERGLGDTTYTRTAEYDGNNIDVSFDRDGDGTPEATSEELSEDKKTPVSALHGWEGKRYTAEPTGNLGTYEAIVYSNVGEPTMGKKFGSAAGGNEFEYTLPATGLVIDTTTDTAIQMRVASPSFDQSAGVKAFKRPANNVAVMIPGTYHGVSGTYSCTPTGTAICASRVAADGFQLGTVTSATDSTFAAGATGWTFKPTDPNARVTEMPDTIYASYGWWIHKSEDGSVFTASAFVSDKGAVPDAADLDGLEGTATYMGGAAGKYALSSSTGGTNDAGHFTATATLEADFSDNSITGTIDDFHGADGMERDWSVELKEAAIAATGGITRAGDDDTAWTIDGTAAAASGQWSGSLQDNGDDGVPKVGTGTFFSTYNGDGRMVGAFGVNKE